MVNKRQFGYGFQHLIDGHLFENFVYLLLKENLIIDSTSVSVNKPFEFKLEKNSSYKLCVTKNGFVPFDTHIFKLGNDEQTDIMMKLVL